MFYSAVYRINRFPYQVETIHLKFMAYLRGAYINKPKS